MRKFVIFIGLVLFICVSTPAHGLSTSHPILLFQKGMEQLSSYRGDSSRLLEARRVFIQLIEKFPDSPLGYLGMSRLNIIEAYRFADRYNVRDIHDQALPFALKALSLGSALQEVHENYALLEKILREHEKRQRHAQQSLFLFPHRPETHFTVAGVLYDQAEYLRAIEHYELALDLKPDKILRVKILEQMALIYLQDLRQSEKAAERYQQALAISDTSDLEQGLGIAFLEAGQYAAAAEHLTKAFKASGNSLAEYYLLLAKGYSAAENAKFAQAVIFLEKAYAHGIRDNALYHRLGDLYYQTGDYANAYVFFRLVIDLDPRDPGAYFLAGRSVQSLGNTALAKDYYKKCLEISTQTTEADWIRKNIPDLHSK